MFTIWVKECSGGPCHVGLSHQTLAHKDGIGTIRADTGDIGRLGHGLGMQLTEQPSLAAFDTTELVEGMVLTLEPSLTIGPGRMMVHEENIAITATGAQLLSRRAPQDIPVI